MTFLTSLYNNHIGYMQSSTYNYSIQLHSIKEIRKLFVEQLLNETILLIALNIGE